MSDNTKQATAKPKNGNGSKLLTLTNADMQAIKNTVTATARKTLSLFGISQDDKRNLNKVYGWKDPSSRTWQYYLDLYRYTSVGRTIVDIVADTCWRDGAWLAPSADSDERIEDEKIQELARRGLFTELCKADKLNRIGEYAVLYCSMGDGEKPAKEVSKKKINIDDVSFSAYTQEGSSVSNYDSAPESGRYGLPEAYQLVPGSVVSAPLADTRQSITAHWHRCIHLAEGSLNNALAGTSALEHVANAIEDWQKVRGGAAEGFFRGARPKMAGDVDKDATLGDVADKTSEAYAAFQEMMQQFNNDLLDIVMMEGVNFRQFSATSGNPAGIYEMIARDLSSGSRIPQRIIFGFGAGELAGYQDKASFNQLINDRQNSFCTKAVENAVLNFERIGYLELPKQWVVRFPLMEAMDELTAADVKVKEADAILKTASAITSYADSPGADSLIPEDVYRREVLGMNLEEIEAEQQQVNALGD